MKNNLTKLGGLIVLTYILVNPNNLEAQTTPDWPMAGANPARTSWTSTSMPNNLSAKWIKPIGPYVSQNVQVVAAEGKVFLSTANGLFAFDANTGNELWMYATELPVGHSPTYDNGKIYFGGLDRKIHAVNTSNGQQVWTFEAEGGFSTSPLVVNGKVYAGSRDSYMYAINTSNGTLAWKYKAGNQILQSAAFKSENDDIASTSQGTIYFGAMDAHVYALNAASGSLVWKSEKLPGGGWYSWWPVIHDNFVILTKTRVGANWKHMHDFVFPTKPSSSLPYGITGTEPGNWPTGEKTYDVRQNPNGQSILDYYEQNPHYRNAFFLNRVNGQETNFDLDSDGVTDAAPLTISGDAGQSAYPVVNESNNQIYFRSLSNSSGAIPGGMPVAWKIGTPYISVPMNPFSGSTPDLPLDEPFGMSTAGNKLYWFHTDDRNIGAVDLSKPNTSFPTLDQSRQWRYLNQDSHGAPNGLPADYRKEAEKFYWNPPSPALYWAENDKIGPTLYDGKLYVVMHNALVAFSSDGLGATSPVLSTAPFPTTFNEAPTMTESLLKQKLESEVQKMVNAGHLKPSYMRDGGGLGFRVEFQIDDFGGDYWHNPADLHYVLLRALPHVSPGLQTQVKTYLQNEYANFSPATYAHIGWSSGTKRDLFDYPPVELQQFEANFAPMTATSFAPWGLPPHNIYAVWRYAKAGLGNPATLFSSIQNKLSTTPADDVLIGMPHVLNSFIAGHVGFIELAKLANQPQSVYATKETELQRLYNLKLQNLTAFPTPNTGNGTANVYFYSMITAWNFMYMVPELADYLRTNAWNNVSSIIDKYDDIAPHWMEAINAEIQAENALMLYQQTHAQFQAHALILGDSQAKLSKLVDTPIVPVGDLYYIDNLVSTIEAPTSSGTPTPNLLPGDINNDGAVNVLDYTLLSNAFGTSNAAADINDDGIVNVLDFTLLSNNFGATS